MLMKNISFQLPKINNLYFYLSTSPLIADHHQVVEACIFFVALIKNPPKMLVFFFALIFLFLF